MKNTSLSRFLQLLLLIVLLGVILYVGKPLFIPLSFALLISFIIYPICKWLEAKGIGKATAIIINLVLITFLLSAIVFLLVQQLASFTKDWPLLKAKLLQSFQDLSVYLTTKWHISKEVQEDWLEKFSSNSSTHLFELIQTTISNSAVTLVLLLLIPIYSFLILYYRRRLVNALQLMLPDALRNKVPELATLAIESYYGFIKGMLLVYLIVGILNSVGLLLLGIPHAIFFGCVAAILTFIPYVGIMVASLFPITISWVTYNSVVYPLAVIAIFAFVQYLEANIIFPWAVSKRLNLNTFMTIVAIIAGGILWGAAGMILFVPFAAIAKLIAERVEGGEAITMLLGDEKNGQGNKTINR
ncbi:AI-2E family transporter [Flavihumibacter rivuli]|uniref:AI-2E family transporter n=1 Tax=Flavihumibacter rivuli TaxID=2838156 RepID=UPI001BDE03CE|nr:AI-2E family transporter [Flavihumibacter rivuli]ULQ57510.1 AI-2E family transporter [Flavihumibacter rivuli]